MQERHQIKFINTFTDFRQFQIKLDQTNFEVGDYENLYFILNGLAYKIHNINYRRKKSISDPDKYDILGKVFYFERETNIIFQRINTSLVEKQMLDLIITDEDLSSFGAIIAK